MVKSGDFRWITSAAATVYSFAIVASAGNEIDAVSAPPFSLETTISVDSSKESRDGNLEDQMFAPRFNGLRFIETLVTAHR
ncbi:hypothetical protein ZOSMA_409G00160 [Zostera marina]|uniref:Uncharacterized protein n=1 Tax=Zostera marina TaxID=29655 RepID=A0A0K9P397_ZOSMR|nr:hypothetical protein ZOSMA_409G00160 [Zostera marina]